MHVRFAALAVLWPWLLAGLLSALPGLALAQSGSSASKNPLAAVAAPAAPAAPAAIALADITFRADADERFAEGVMLRAGSEDPSLPLVPRLAEIEKSVDEKTRQFSLAQLKVLPVLRLESLERHWKFDARRFSRWQSDMRAASLPYAQDAADLAQRRADWEATRTAIPPGDLPAALSARIDALIALLKRAEQALSAPLAKQITLGQRANNVDARIQAGMKSVSAAIDYIDSRLIRLDSPPLWAVTPGDEDQQGALNSIANGVSIEAHFLREYGAANLSNQRALNVLQLILLPVLVWLGLRSRKAQPDDDPALQEALRVLRRPVSAWLLLSMMGVLAFEPEAPLMLHQIAMLIALVPVLRLLPSTVQRLLGPWPYVASGLYLLERLGLIFVASSFLFRWYHIGLTLLALAITVWLLWRSRGLTQVARTQRVGRVVHTAAWVSVVVLAISAASNILGNVSLAEMLTSGVIDSGYFGLVLYAGVAVFFALLHLMFGRRAISHFRIGHDQATPLLQLFKRLLMIAALVGWAVFTLNRFRVFRPLYEFASSVLRYKFTFGEITLSLGHVLVFAVSVLIAFWTAKTVRYLLQEEVLGKMSLPRGVGNSVASLTYYALLLLGVIVALSAAGFKVSQLAFVFGALGVGIGFGLQNVVNNFVSGLILMFERPIQPGDVVEITGTSGRVGEIGMRATTIKTFDGADVVVPNGTLLSEKLTNWTLLDRNRRIDIALGVAYGTDPGQVITLLRGVIEQTTGILKDPAPTVLFMGFGASSLDFSIRAWAYDYDNSLNIRSDLMTRLLQALVAANIEIPFPQQDLHLRSVSDDARNALFNRPADDRPPPG